MARRGAGIELGVTGRLPMFRPFRAVERPKSIPRATARLAGLALPLPRAGMFRPLRGGKPIVPQTQTAAFRGGTAGLPPFPCVALTGLWDWCDPYPGRRQGSRGSHCLCPGLVYGCPFGAGRRSGRNFRLQQAITWHPSPTSEVGLLSRIGCEFVRVGQSLLD